MNIRTAIIAFCLFGCASRPAPLTSPADKAFRQTAPDSFDVEFNTTKGRMLVRAYRGWSPLGVDRLYVLTRNNYFDSAAFYRVVPQFVAQFGYSGDTAVNRAWARANIPDEPVHASNTRGTLSYARSGPNTRSTQFYFNIVDNARLDTLNGFGFPPIAKVIEGVEVLDSLNGEYGNAPNQGGRIPRGGNAFLARQYPRLDYILSARITRTWK